MKNPSAILSNYLSKVGILPKIEREGVFSWGKLIEKDKNFWNKKLTNVKSGQKILIATSLGGYNQGAILESALAVALTLRGIDIDILLCDQFLPACQLTKIQKISPSELTKHGQLRLCQQCFAHGVNLFTPLDIRVLQFSNFIEGKEKRHAEDISQSLLLNKIREFRLFDCNIGEHAYAGCLRYFARGDINEEENGEDILRKYVRSAVLTAYVTKNLLKQKKYDAICFHHGIYVPQGIIGEIARSKKVRVVNWNPAYRKHCFIFSHHDSYHHTMISEPAESWDNIPWTSKLENQITKYLYSRRVGKNDWIWFHRTPEFNLKKIKKELNIDFNKPIIGMLTNVVWDAQLHYPSSAFPNMMVWVMQTISYFQKRPDLQMVLRIHPAEVSGAIPSRQPLLPEIKKMFPQLPENIHIIPPNSTISTYTVMEQCNAVIIYNTKTGIEISSLGIPVIVAGEAWIRNKGFSYDATTAKEYFNILDKLPMKKRLTKRQINRAKKYAFHFFFRRMIPLSFVSNPKQFEFSLDINSIKDLSKGKNKGLDIICEGIIQDKPFIYPAEYS